MSVMGFSHDPGPLPFTTIRDAKWANRLTGVPPYVEIVGEHGCTLLRQVAKVVAIADYPSAPPAHLASIYNGKKLVAIQLAAPTPKELRAAGIPGVSNA